MKVNILRRLPFPDDHFDVVYSSHVLEHFPRETTAAILGECLRVLKPEGILRTVIPDLENTCREYIRILDTYEISAESRQRYEWIVLELLDQLIRTQASGKMYVYIRQLMAHNDQQLLSYVQSRTGMDSSPSPAVERTSRWQGITWNRIKTKLTYSYIAAVKRLLPAGMRATIIDDTRIGEKHKWMYDHVGLKLLLEECGFGSVAFHTAATSEITDFNSHCLDVEPDGTAYKPVSLFCEARKPRHE